MQAFTYPKTFSRKTNRQTTEPHPSRANAVMCLPHPKVTGIYEQSHSARCMSQASRPVSPLKLLKASKCFGGANKRYEYSSQSCDCPLTFTIYFPPAAEKGPVPVVYYLASLTTDDETFISQAGAQRRAAELGVALVCSDNSPRNIPGIPEQGEGPQGWVYGYANSWYLNATAPSFRNWQMRQWIAEELPEVLHEYFPNLNTRNASIMGFSMGGHGALTIGLSYPQQYTCISAFAPVCTPSSSAVGEHFFAPALGPDKEVWKIYDASELVRQYKGPHRDILLDVGSRDHHIPNVNPEKFAEAASGNQNVSVLNRVQEGYGHDFAFVATFIDEHLEWHMQHLVEGQQTLK